MPLVFNDTHMWGGIEGRRVRGCNEGSKEGNEGARNKGEMVTMNRKMERKIMKCRMRKRQDECRKSRGV